MNGMKVLNPLPGRMPFLSLVFWGDGEAFLSLVRTSDFKTTAVIGGKKTALSPPPPPAVSNLLRGVSVILIHPLFILASLRDVSGAVLGTIASVFWILLY